ncbi:uncharacterized protein [Typha latifolia]|uniref:uncharacterized protein n=1 Tax=Typha latifolia TaxID=4733 RepID=UPI003C2C69B9
MQARSSKLLFSKFLRHLSSLPRSWILESRSSSLLPSRSLLAYTPGAQLSTIPSRPMRGDRRARKDDPSEDVYLRTLNCGDDVGERRKESSQESPPARTHERPLRGDRRPQPSRGAGQIDVEAGDFFPELEDGDEMLGRSRRLPRNRTPNRPTGGGPDDLFRDGDNDEEFESLLQQESPPRFSNKSKAEEKKDSINKEKGAGGLGETLFEKLDLGDDSGGGGDKMKETYQKPLSAMPESPPQDADEIFKKMKETGLIPNAVAMLDGLCKDGLIQEAMKLFGLMREKGTIPEVVIYTAVVEGFCKAAKFDDAKRIFRKMQKNGIVPNAFSYSVLIQGLCRGGKLEDAVEFCTEMFEAGHSPNAATYIGLVDGFCKEKGVEEGEKIVRNFRERDFIIDEKAVKEHLDKKGPFSPLVWEAIFGKKNSHRPF